MRYDYLENIKNDILDYIEENKSNIFDEQFNFDALYDDLFIEDAITGNASGSYYCNAWRAEESIAHNLDLLAEACEMFGYSDTNYIEKGAEWCDVTIRCYVLGEALEDLKPEIMEMYEEFMEGEDNE